MVHACWLFYFLVVWYNCCDVDSQMWGKSPPALPSASLPCICVCPQYFNKLLPLSPAHCLWSGLGQRCWKCVTQPLGAWVQSWLWPSAGHLSHSCHLPYRLSHKEGILLWLVGEHDGGQTVVRLPQAAHVAVTTGCLRLLYRPVHPKPYPLSLCAILLGLGSE